MHATQHTVFGEGTTSAETRLQGDCHPLLVCSQQQEVV